ncbi:MAG: hypothetical protein ACRD1B_00995 [Thermoanaerobaculia bacterium]
MERLERRDARFILICLAVILAGAAVTGVLFRRAFPEASIEFRVGRQEARALAEKFLAERRKKIADHRFAGRFGVEEEPKVYLERELGLERASDFYGRDAKVWRWEMRWFRSGVTEEERVALSPLGDLVSFQSILRDDAPGASLPREEARAISRRFLEERGLGVHLKSVEARPVVRPHRTEWIFVDERDDLRMGEATVRYATTVSGNELTGFQEFVHVPESWQRDYRRLRSRNEAAGQAATLGLFLTFLAMLGVLISKIVRKDVPWRLVAMFGGVAFLLALLSAANGLPLSLYEYDTASPLSDHIAKRLLFGFLGALATGAGIALVVAAAEPIYRERFPAQLSLRSLLSRRGLRSKRFFRGLLLGYALTAFFFAYQAIFYVVAARFGAWAPAEVPYDDLLNTAFPWATVLLIGLLPAVSEEGISRMFSISFLDRLGAGRLIGVMLPAFIWGFGHAGYPNQPFYIRGIEVGCAGVLIGAVMLRSGVWPLLVWHFTVDALYTALLLLRSHNLYYMVSGGVAAFILLLPLTASLLLYWRRGGFEPDTGLTNGDEGFVPAPLRSLPPPEEVPPVRLVPVGHLRLVGALALILATGFFVPVSSPEWLSKDRTGRHRAEETARAFLLANGVSLERYRTISYGGTGFADDLQVRDVKPEENGRLPGFSEAAAQYVLKEGGLPAFERLAKERLPLAFWVVRFFEPQKKEEWKILVDARRGRVVGFLNPKEEAAAAASIITPDRAGARALETAARLGYPVADAVAVELGTQVRPRRTDTTVVLESPGARVAQARPRLTAVFHGSRLAAFYPSIRVPESFLREYRRSGVFDEVLLGAKVVAIGAFIGLGVIFFLRIVRQPDFHWKGLAWPLAAAGLLIATALANSFHAALRQYSTAMSLELFRFSTVLSLILVELLLLCAAGVAFVLFFAGRPGWRQAMRSRGRLSDALLRAGVAALGVIALAHWKEVLSGRFPLFFGPDPSLPSALDRTLPSLAVFDSVAVRTLLFASVASVAAMVAREAWWRRPAARVLAVLGLVFALGPASLRSGGEFAAQLLPALVTIGWLALSAFLLLRDHVAAWVLFGVVAYGGPAVAELVAQGSPEDRAAGWGALLLILLAAVLLLSGRRRRLTAES